MLMSHNLLGPRLSLLRSVCWLSLRTTNMKEARSSGLGKRCKG